MRIIINQILLNETLMKTLNTTNSNTLSNSITTRLNYKLKAVIFAVASVIFGISSAMAQIIPGVDVDVPIVYQAGFQDSSVTHNVCFKNTSPNGDDRINVSSVSSNGWVVALFENNNLMALDADGDGSWDYISLPYDTDHNGEPETFNLSAGGQQCLNFMVFIPEGTPEGTMDTLTVTGYSVLDRNIKDAEFAITEIEKLMVLPIELLSFSAKFNGEAVAINWETATEINNDYFSIERSANGIDFTEIMVVRGAGNSNAISSYTINDKEPVSGTSYYRLKQTDYDGQSETFKAVMVRNIKVAQSISIDQNAYPNPFTATFNIGYNVEERGNVTIKLSDIQGRIISQEVVAAAKGSNAYSFENGSSLPMGMYFISLEHNGNVSSAKISKSTDF
jgi:hypothetical protein